METSLKMLGKKGETSEGKDRPEADMHCLLRRAMSQSVNLEKVRSGRDGKAHKSA